MRSENGPRNVSDLDSANNALTHGNIYFARRENPFVCPPSTQISPLFLKFVGRYFLNSEQTNTRKLRSHPPISLHGGAKSDKTWRARGRVTRSHTCTLTPCTNLSHQNRTSRSTQIGSRQRKPRASSAGNFSLQIQGENSELGFGEGLVPTASRLGLVGQECRKIRHREEFSLHAQVHTHACFCLFPLCLSGRRRGGPKPQGAVTFSGALLNSGQLSGRSRANVSDIFREGGSKAHRVTRPTRIAQRKVSDKRNERGYIFMQKNLANSKKCVMMGVQ